MYQSLYELFSGLGGNALNSFLSLAMDLIRKMFAASGNCCLVRRKVWSSFPLIRHFLKTLWHVSWLSCTPRLASHFLCFITTPTILDVKWWKRDCLAASLWWRPALTLSTVLVRCLSCLVNMQVCCCFHGLVNSYLRNWSFCSLGSLMSSFRTLLHFLLVEARFQMKIQALDHTANLCDEKCCPYFLTRFYAGWGQVFWGLCHFTLEVIRTWVCFKSLLSQIKFRFYQSACLSRQLQCKSIMIFKFLFNINKPKACH